MPTATFVLSGINHLGAGDTNLSQLPVWSVFTLSQFSLSHNKIGYHHHNLNGGLKQVLFCMGENLRKHLLFQNIMCCHEDRLCDMRFPRPGDER